ncbi:MAG TPA: siderophore-interacting protein [Cellulomonas sp.]
MTTAPTPHEPDPLEPVGQQHGFPAPSAQDEARWLQQGEALLRSPDHDRDLHDVTATIVDLDHPTGHLLRFTAALPEHVAGPDWAARNVTIRMELGPGYDEASRVYTIRRYHPVTGTVEVDVVLHGATSPMMRWSRDLRPGSSLRFRGPRQHFIVPDFPDRPVALFLDATAVPALLTMLEQWTHRAGGVGWVQTDDLAAFEELPAVPGLDLHRIDPTAEEPGALLRRAALVERPEGCVVWGAGERDDMRALRRYFRSEVGLPKDHLALYGYWKRGTTNTEIDMRRLANYARLVETGGSLEDVDDLAIEI